MADRHNRTLKDMMRSMISRTNLLESLWGKAIKTNLYFLNRVLNKSVSKTSFKLQIGIKRNLNHFHIWGCLAEVRIYNPSKKKKN